MLFRSSPHEFILIAPLASLAALARSLRSPNGVFNMNHFCASWSHLRTILDHLGVVLAPCFPPWGLLGQSRRHLEPFWRHLGASWCLLGAPWPHLGPSGRHLGPSWRHLGPSWARLGLAKTSQASPKTLKFLGFSSFFVNLYIFAF